MPRIPLSDTSDWQLKFDEQDVRGFTALDADGNPVGRVDHMLVNTEEERVDAVVLEDGTEYPARDLSIGDNVVYLTAAVGGEAVGGDVDPSVTVYDDYGHVVRRADVAKPDYDHHADAFRSHHTEQAGLAAGLFATREPAYRYGYESAFDEKNRSRGYTEAQTDLQRTYATRHPDRTYDEDQDAIEYGYTRAQRGR